MNNDFNHVGIRPADKTMLRKPKWYQGKPVASALVLGVMAVCCLLCDFLVSADPSYMDLFSSDTAPCAAHWFGTDAMGRDVFSMIWHGGRISLFIGFISVLISTSVAIVYGAVSGMAPKWLDDILMRLADILISIPTLLTVVFIQGILGKANVLSISFVIGITGWMNIAKIVRTEVRQIRNSEYVIASKCMGAGFFHILRRHLIPELISSIMFMVVMNIRGAIISEATLSFMGIGLPIGVVSWGSMLSLAEKAMLTGSWWIILFPGVFLIVTLVCITDIGNYLRKKNIRSYSNL